LNEQSKRYAGSILLLISILISANTMLGFSLSDSQITDSTEYWPSTDWRESTPEDQGLNSTKLNELSERLESETDIDSILIIKNGHLVYEEYPSGEFTPSKLHFLASCTKSFISALIGIAIHEGCIESVDVKVLDLFPDHSIADVDSRKESLTIEHLLTMTSGFDWDEWTYFYGEPNNTLTQMYDSGNPVQFVLDCPMRSNPGAEWVYCSGASHLLSAIIQQTSGMSTLEFARYYLFDHLGILDVFWLQDAQGVFLGGGGLSLSSRDMAKFGYLFLRNGLWNDKQLIPSEWVANSSDVKTWLGNYDGYGWQWWNIPAIGVTYASGLYGQKICVFPAYDTVVIFTAYLQNQTIEVQLLTEIIVPAIFETVSVLDTALFGSYLTVMFAPLIVALIIYVRKRSGD